MYYPLFVLLSYCCQFPHTNSLLVEKYCLVINTSKVQEIKSYILKKASVMDSFGDLEKEFEINSLLPYLSLQVNVVKSSS